MRPEVPPDPNRHQHHYRCETCGREMNSGSAKFASAFAVVCTVILIVIVTLVGVGAIRGLAGWAL